MDKYTATFGKSRSRIISVHAKSVKEADAEIERQLDRPGRRALLGQWQAGNRMMIVNNGLVTINAKYYDSRTDRKREMLDKIIGHIRQ